MKKILVPVDGSSFSDHALPAAIALARRPGAELHLVQVHEPIVLPAGPETLPMGDPRIDQQRRADEENYLRGLAARCEDRGVQATTTLLEGPIVTAISNYAGEVGVDCIVMTTHGRGGLSRLWMGSIADALVRHASVPLLLIRPHTEDVQWDRGSVPDHILIPLDGSPLSERALAPAMAWGRVSGARFTLLRVVLPLPFVGTAGMPPVFAPDALTIATDAAAVALEEVAERMRKNGVSVNTAVVVHATPANAILDYAATHAVSGIAMATHGRGGWSRVALGSVADKVMRGTTMPMLLLAPFPEDTA